MVDSGLILSYFIFGPFGLILTFLKFGYPPTGSTFETALALYMASGVGTVMWLTVAGAIGGLVR